MCWTHWWISKQTIMKCLLLALVFMHVLTSAAWNGVVYCRLRCWIATFIVCVRLFAYSHYCRSISKCNVILFLFAAVHFTIPSARCIWISTHASIPLWLFSSSFFHILGVEPDSLFDRVTTDRVGKKPIAQQMFVRICLSAFMCMRVCVWVCANMWKSNRRRRSHCNGNASQPDSRWLELPLIASP